MENMRVGGKAKEGGRDEEKEEVCSLPAVGA